MLHKWPMVNLRLLWTEWTKGPGPHLAPGATGTDPWSWNLWKPSPGLVTLLPTPPPPLAETMGRLWLRLAAAPWPWRLSGDLGSSITTPLSLFLRYLVWPNCRSCTLSMRSRFKHFDPELRNLHGVRLTHTRPRSRDRGIITFWRTGSDDVAQLLDYSNTHRARALFAWTQVLKMEGDTVAGPASPPTSHTHTHRVGLFPTGAWSGVSACFAGVFLVKNLVQGLILKPHFLWARICRLKATVAPRCARSVRKWFLSTKWMQSP